MEPRNVLIISSEFPPGPGGIGKHAFDLAQALEEKAYRVAVCTSQDYCSDSEIEGFNASLPAGISLYRFNRTPYFTYANRWRTIRALIRSHRPALVIVTGRFSLWMGYLIQTAYGKKIQVHAFVHGSELRKSHALHHTITRKALLRIPHLWAVSAFTRNLVLQHTGRKDIRILPNGLWTADWILEDGVDGDRKLNGTPSLLTVGRISIRKGQHHVVHSMPALIREFPGIHYHIIGIDSMKHLLEPGIRKLGLGSKVTFHGRLPTPAQLSQIYRSGDIMIMLSENQPDGEVEGFGIVILEANYFGIPAIGSRGCGIDDAIVHGYNGALVNGSNPAEIAAALRHIMNHYSVFSANAREWALKHDWRNLADGFLRKESQMFSIPEPSGMIPTGVTQF